MEPTFNLVHQPWIPCVDSNGQTTDLSLRDVLARAHELREISDGSPLVSAALYRLLLALLHRVFGPAGYDAWDLLWQRGYWPGEQLDQYFDRWGERFDLFDADHPFYQVPTASIGPRPAFNLVHSIDNNPTLFNHITGEAGVALTPAEAARELVASQAFHTSGTRDPSKNLTFHDSPCTRGIVFIVEGQSLFETLALNLIRYPDAQTFGGDGAQDDRPAWEMDDPYLPVRSTPFGYLDYLTWQSLRLKLIPAEENGVLVVREILDLPGLRFDSKDGALRDPMMNYRVVGKKEMLRPLQFTEDRALWRDSSTLFAVHDPSVYTPRAFGWFFELVNEGYLAEGQRVRAMALGMSGSQAKVDFYRHERLPLRAEYLQSADLTIQATQALALAQNVHAQLWGALHRLAELSMAPAADQEGGHKPAPADTRQTVAHWDVLGRYWGALEPVFWRLLDGLLVDADAAQNQWAGELRAAAWDAFEAAEALAGISPTAAKAVVRARGQLGGGLKKVLANGGGK